MSFLNQLPSSANTKPNLRHYYFGQPVQTPLMFIYLLLSSFFLQLRMEAADLLIFIGMLNFSLTFTQGMKGYNEFINCYF